MSRAEAEAGLDAPAATRTDVPTATEATLIEMVLGIPGVGPRVLSAHGLAGMGRLSPEALAQDAQIALQDATRLAAALELGRRHSAARRRRGARLTNPSEVARYFAPTLAPLVHEELWLAALDNTNRIRGARMVSRGGIHGAHAGPADVLRAAIEMAAVSFILVHNHPSGDPRPTPEDEEATVELRRLSRALTIPLQLHVIVTPSGRYAAVLD
jgi:DNA repair protein RadC